MDGCLADGVRVELWKAVVFKSGGPFEFFTLCKGVFLIAIHESLVSVYNSYPKSQEHE